MPMYHGPNIDDLMDAIILQGHVHGAERILYGLLPLENHGQVDLHDPDYDYQTDGQLPWADEKLPDR
jgi:hypothetical protein